MPSLRAASPTPATRLEHTPMPEDADRPEDPADNLRVEIDELAERIHFDEDRPDQQSVIDPAAIRQLLEP